MVDMARFELNAMHPYRATRSYTGNAAHGTQSIVSRLAPSAPKRADHHHDSQTDLENLTLPFREFCEERPPATYKAKSRLGGIFVLQGTRYKRARYREISNAKSEARKRVGSWNI